MVAAVPKCDGCGKKVAVCKSRAGLSVFFIDKDGKPYDDPNRWVYLCNDCCGHGGEEGRCYRASDGTPTDQLSDEELYNG